MIDELPNNATKEEILEYLCKLNHILDDLETFLLKNTEFHSRYSDHRGLSRDAVLKLFASLSPREHDVVLLLCSGLSNKEIGLRLTISPDTVKTHIKNALVKFNLHGRFELQILLREYRIVDSIVLPSVYSTFYQDPDKPIPS